MSKSKSDTEPDTIEPGIDPATRKIGTRACLQARDSDSVYTDEPASLGGGNAAPSPLETALVALAGSDGMIIDGVAQAMGFDYAGVEVTCESQIDARGSKGVPGVRPPFESATLDITVYSDESDARFRQLCKNVESRCPILSLFHAADVEMTVSWVQRPAGDYDEDMD